VKKIKSDFRKGECILQNIRENIPEGFGEDPKRPEPGILSVEHIILINYKKGFYEDGDLTTEKRGEGAKQPSAIHPWSKENRRKGI